MEKGEVESLTQFSSTDGEVSLQEGELLDLLGVGCGSGVDALNALLNGIKDRRLPVGDDLRHFSGRDAELSAHVQSLGAQLVCGLTAVVHHALRKHERPLSLCPVLRYVASTVCRNGDRWYFESEQHGEELELVSEQHGVADDGHLGL